MPTLELSYLLEYALNKEDFIDLESARKILLAKQGSRQEEEEGVWQNGAKVIYRLQALLQIGPGREEVNSNARY